MRSLPLFALVLALAVLAAPALATAPAPTPTSFETTDAELLATTLFGEFYVPGTAVLNATRARIVVDFPGFAGPSGVYLQADDGDADDPDAGTVAGTPPIEFFGQTELIADVFFPTDVDITIPATFVVNDFDYEYTDTVAVWIDGVNIALFQKRLLDVPNIIDGNIPFTSFPVNIGLGSIFFSMPITSVIPTIPAGLHTIKIWVANGRDNQYDSGVIVFPMQLTGGIYVNPVDLTGATSAMQASSKRDCLTYTPVNSQTGAGHTVVYSGSQNREYVCCSFMGVQTSPTECSRATCDGPASYISVEADFFSLGIGNLCFASCRAIPPVFEQGASGRSIFTGDKVTDVFFDPSGSAYDKLEIDIFADTPVERGWIDGYIAIPMPDTAPVDGAYIVRTSLPGQFFACTSKGTYNEFSDTCDLARCGGVSFNIPFIVDNSTITSDCYANCYYAAQLATGY
eukprot:Unigene3244_Nuclearia_a/m.9951 Unigene3244_Nuclearia_a/g.9951  ORF Unigene3244_Nuclearia_a/g.9951 Unigene3244_Nuclearia_a/m.9951 type:complete len:456 (+) Unigene3244_Nuclearia_a:52-1419(+)